MKQRKNETKEEFNARANEYMKARYFRRRAAAVEYLGGKCVDCQDTEMLEFDHIDPALKTYSISKLFAGASEKILMTEVNKCVLRCVACHGHVTALQKLQTVNLLRL